MKRYHVPSFLMTHSALAFVFGLTCAWAIGVGHGPQVVVLDARLDSVLLVGAGAVVTLFLQRIALWGWKRYVRTQAGEVPGARRLSPAMAAPTLPGDPGRRPATAGRTAMTP
ncbi:MAG: hypothetical protein ACREK6_05605 [Candidatus Rokuibacteriota bacterium]